MLSTKRFRLVSLPLRLSRRTSSHHTQNKQKRNACRSVGQHSHSEAGGQLLSRFRPQSIQRRVSIPCRGVSLVLPRGISRQRRNRESAAPISSCRWRAAFLGG